jgi:arabinose-5-phosphate isomerase
MSKDALELAKEIIAIEIEALQAMANRLDDGFQRAIEIILSTRGRVVVIGMGKSGLIGQKIVATLASTGTPSFFVHPGEAYHGDLGMIKRSDVALLISNSGETEEVIRLLPFLQYQKNKMIAMTGRIDSTLAHNVDVVLNITVDREACTNNLAPTSSTTATLVMGDALAVVLARAKNFKPEDFARFHPGGSLGRRLLTRVCDVMRKENLPVCAPNDQFKEVVQIISRGRLGITIVMDDKELLGVITDGDLRRTLESNSLYGNLQAKEMMTESPVRINSGASILDAESIMKKLKINALIVENDYKQVVGLIQIYDDEVIDLRDDKRNY